MDEIKDSICRNFCEYLNQWKNDHWTGTDKDLGKWFDVSKGQISNVLKMRRCGNETWRRMVANKIGVDYENMIYSEATEDGGQLSDPPQLYITPNHGQSDETKLVSMTKKILSSKTEYAESLAANIRSFHRAVDNEERINKLVDRLSLLEAQIQEDRRKGERRKNDNFLTEPIGE